MVRMILTELEDAPAGKPVTVRVYIPRGTTFVVEMVRVEVTPVEVRVMLEGEKVRVPHGLGPEITWHTVGLGETDSVRVTGWAVPLVRVAVIKAVTDEPVVMEALVGLTDRVYLNGSVSVRVAEPRLPPWTASPP